MAIGEEFQKALEQRDDDLIDEMEDEESEHDATLAEEHAVAAYEDALEDRAYDAGDVW